VNPVGPDLPRKKRVASDEQDEPSPATDFCELSCDAKTIGGAEVTKHEGCPAGEVRGRCAGVGRSLRVGEEKQRRQGGTAGGAVEPPRDAH
jgi:hypothetical protein